MLTYIFKVPTIYYIINYTRKKFWVSKTFTFLGRSEGSPFTVSKSPSCFCLMTSYLIPSGTTPWVTASSRPPLVSIVLILGLGAGVVVTAADFGGTVSTWTFWPLGRVIWLGEFALPESSCDWSSCFSRDCRWPSCNENCFSSSSFNKNSERVPQKDDQCVAEEKARWRNYVLFWNKRTRIDGQKHLRHS